MTAAPAAVSFISSLFWRQPLQAFYIALALFAGVFTFTTLHQEFAEPLTKHEAAISYLEETMAQPVDIPLSEAETAVIDAAPAPAAADSPVAAVPPPPAAPTWLEYRIRRGDTLERILRTLYSPDDMRDYLLKQKMKTYRRLRTGSVIYFQQDKAGNLQNLLYKTSPEYYFSAGRDEQGALWVKEAPPATSIIRRQYYGVIESSLFAAAGGMSDIAVTKLVQVLETQIDFYRDVRKGDTFRVIYDIRADENGEVIAVDDIIAFEYDSKLESRPRRIRGVYYDNGKISGYYTPEGDSLQRAFLPAPLKYRRISSRFSKNRFHPVLKRWRPHRGVDYAAATGTPVQSTADGIVSLVDKQRGYGRVVMIKHFNIYTTVYAHLKAFRKGIRRGKRVKQGEIIGYVGQSGLATGPHLHYEFRVRGKHRDPLSTVLPKQLPSLKDATLKQFEQYSAPLFTELDNLQTAAGQV